VLALLILLPSSCHALDKPECYSEITKKVNADTTTDYSIIERIAPPNSAIFDYDDFPYPLDALINLSTLKIGCSNVQMIGINNSILHLKLYERVKKGDSLFICINYSTYQKFDLETTVGDFTLQDLVIVNSSECSTYSINVTYSLPYNLDSINRSQEYYVPFISYPSEWENYDPDLKTSMISRNPISINFFKEVDGDKNPIFFSNMIYYLFKTNPTIKLTQNDIHPFPDPNGQENIKFSNTFENRTIIACVKYNNQSNLVESIYFLTNESQVCDGEYYTIGSRDTIPINQTNQTSFFNYASEKCNDNPLLEKLGFPFDCVKIKGTRDIGSIFDESQNPFDLEVSYVMTVKPKANYILDTKKSSICILPSSIDFPEIKLFERVYSKENMQLSEDFLRNLGGCNSKYFTLEATADWVGHRIRSRKLDTFKSGYTKINQTNYYYSDNIKFKMNMPLLTYNVHYTLIFYRDIIQKIILLLLYVSTTYTIFLGADIIYFAYKRNARNPEPRRRKIIESLRYFLTGGVVKFTKNESLNAFINLIIILFGGGGVIGFYRFYSLKGLVNSHNPLLLFFPIICSGIGIISFKIYLGYIRKCKTKHE